MAKTIHGLSYSNEHNIWRAMKQRCKNKNATNYAYYGEQGVSVCKKWDLSFEAFYKDMGPRPSKDHSVERLDSGRGYSKRNCKWATRSEQNRNRKVKSQTSKYRGVSFRKDRNVWRAYLVLNHKQYNFGVHKTELEAASAYDEGCWNLFKDPKFLNFPDEYKKRYV